MEESFEATLRAGSMMAACWSEAAKMTDQELDDAVEVARKADLAYPYPKRKRFLFWTWYPKKDQAGVDLFNRWFYLADARKIRRAKRRLGVTDRDIALTSKDQWISWLGVARNEPDVPLVTPSPPPPKPEAPEE